MRLMTIILFLLTFSSCGMFQRTYTHFTGELSYKCSKEGVEYVQTENELFISLLPDGSIATCGDKQE